MPCFFHRVIEMHQGTSILVYSYAHIVQEVESVIGELRLSREQVGESAAGQIRERSQETDEEWLRMWVTQEVHSLWHFPDLDEYDKRGY